MEEGHKTLRLVLRWILALALLLVVGYFGLLIASTYLALRSGRMEMSQVMLPALAALNTLGGTAWSFARPLLQLLVVLLIVDWILKRMGIQFSSATAAASAVGRQFNWDVQAIIAVIVIAAYAVAQLAGLGGEGMKDIALVVVGFYFGTQRRSYEVDPETGKMRVIEDHINTLADQNPALRGGKGKAPETPEAAPLPGTAQAAEAAQKAEAARKAEAAQAAETAQAAAAAAKDEGDGTGA